jgi:ABC-type spermidine/putrescine transport system permease subunit I
MRKHILFLKCSSVTVKIVAWIFLLLGILGAVSLFSGSLTNQPRWMGVVVLVFYSFMFFIFILIAKMADILVKLINAAEAEKA